MNQNKQTEILRKRNSILQEKLDKSNLEVKRAKELIKNLESIKTNWNKELETLKNQQAEYSMLISDLKNIKKELLKKK